MKKFLLICFILIQASIATCQAEFIVTVQQILSDVVATGTGSINTGALSSTGGGVFSPYVDANRGQIGVGSPTNIAGKSGSFTGPSNFGTGDIFLADIGTGDPVSIGSSGFLSLPSLYSSESPLSGSATWTNKTFTDLGLTQGEYTWTWGSGPNADFFKLNIVAASAPEPATLPLFITAMLAQFGIRRFRLKRKA